LVRYTSAYVGVEKGPPPDDISVVDWLGALQRMWVLRKLRLLMTSQFGGNINVGSLMNVSFSVEVILLLVVDTEHLSNCNNTL